MLVLSGAAPWCGLACLVWTSVRFYGGIAHVPTHNRIIWRVVLGICVFHTGLFVGGYVIFRLFYRGQESAAAHGMLE